MTKFPNLSKRATQLVKAKSAEEAYAAGDAVGSLMRDGMPAREALRSTVTIAEFIERGLPAQQAVDAILAAVRLKQGSSPGWAEARKRLRAQPRAWPERTRHETAEGSPLQRPPIPLGSAFEALHDKVQAVRNVISI